MLPCAILHKNPCSRSNASISALALSPLLDGKADITGISLIKPVVSLTSRTQSGTTPPDKSGAVSAGANAQSSDQPASADEEIDLSALSIQRLTISEGSLVNLDEDGKAAHLISDIDLTIRIPDFNGPVALEGSVGLEGQVVGFSGTIANGSDMINGAPTRLDLDLNSDLLTGTIASEVAWKQQTPFLANLSAQTPDVGALAALLNAPVPLQKRPLSVAASIIAEPDDIRLPRLSMAMGDQQMEGAARIFLRPERPLIRLAIDTKGFDLDQLVSTGNVANESAEATNGKSAKPAPAPQTETQAEAPLDLSGLSAFDLTIDMRAGQLTYNGQSARQLKLLAHLLDGKLSADLQSVNLAKGSLAGTLEADSRDLVWKGSLTANGLDVGEMAALAGQDSPLDATLTANLNFAARGLDLEAISKSGNLAGVIAWQGGRFAHPALQQAVPNRETGSLEQMAGRMTLTSLDDPVDANGSLLWNGETIRYASTIGLGEALAGNPVPVSLSLDANPASIALTGLIDMNKLSLSGSKISLDTTSSRALLAWLGQDVSGGTPDMPVIFGARLDVATDRTNLDDLSIRMGQSKGSGSLAYRASGAGSGRPTLKGQLAFETLDITPFLGDGNARGRTANGNPATTNGGGSSSTRSGSTDASGWDSTPIDFSGLKALDADLSLSAKRLIARDIETGTIALLVKLQDGLLTGSFDQLSLYEGAGSGVVSIDARTEPANLAANFALSRLSMADFLSDTVDLKALSGTGAVNLDLTASGRSQSEIIRRLNGTGTLDIRDGQIRGIDIPQMLRSLENGILDGWANSEVKSTDFTALTASFTFTDGIVNNSDLMMLSPLLRLTGAGNVNLPDKRIDYVATPKLIASLQGQGGLVDADGLPLPIIIKGKLFKPRIYPDIPGILENPEAILKGLKKLGKPGEAASKGIERLGNKVTNEIEKQTDRLGIDLNSILNGNTPQPTQPNDQGTDQQQQQPPAQQSSPEQLLRDITKGLFGN